MKPSAFIKTIYLGDRACKSITIDGWNFTVKIQVDDISRIRSESGNWEFYSQEDIKDGLIVFTDVKECELKNDGFLPNDSINSLDFIEEKDGFNTFKLSIDSVNNDATHRETILRVVCKNIHLEDPSRPSVQIVE